MADKITFQTLKKWIPDLTRYRFRPARKHKLLHWRGFPPPQNPTQNCSCHPHRSTTYWISLLSSHVIQDLPSGEKTITLSTNEVVTVSNVIRMLIPESIVKQRSPTYPSQPQDSVKHPFCLCSLYVAARSRLYQFGRSSGL